MQLGGGAVYRNAIESVHLLKENTFRRKVCDDCFLREDKKNNFAKNE